MHSSKTHKENFKITHISNIKSDDLYGFDQVYKTLVSQKDYSPNNEIINKSLAKLVQTISSLQAQKNIDSSEILEKYDHLLITLPKLCALAEIEMEKWWCRRILSSEESVSNFWYFQNYKNLVNSEMRLLESQKATNIVFLGSGSFPLTAIIWAQEAAHCRIRCVDYDEEACNLSMKLIEKTGLSDRISVHFENSEKIKFKRDEIALCASLLDINNLYSNLYDYEVSQIILRVSIGLSRFIYSSSLKPSSALYAQKTKTEMCSDRINISRYYERVCHA